MPLEELLTATGRNLVTRWVGDGVTTSDEVPTTKAIGRSREAKGFTITKILQRLGPTSVLSSVRSPKRNRSKVWRLRNRLMSGVWKQILSGDRLNSASPVP